MDRRNFGDNGMTLDWASIGRRVRNLTREALSRHVSYLAGSGGSIDSHELISINERDWAEPPRWEQRREVIAVETAGTS
jgi:hypothetical protein